MPQLVTARREVYSSYNPYWRCPADHVASYLSHTVITGSLVIFPFLPFMISDFFPELDRTEIGKKAGFLGSAYFIGSFAGSLMVSYY